MGWEAAGKKPQNLLSLLLQLLSLPLHLKPSGAVCSSLPAQGEAELFFEARKTMRPILMKGHERPLTFLKYNRDGDLLFSCAKDHNPTVWFADNGERLGTYRGHNGAVWCCDVSSKINPLPLFRFLY